METSAVVEGYKYDPVKWSEVAKEMHDLGNVANLNFEGKSGWLFWQTAAMIEQLQTQVEHINTTGHYCEFPDECNK